MSDYVQKKQFYQFKELVEQNIDLIVQNRMKDDVYVKQLVVKVKQLTKESEKLRRQNWDLRQRIDQIKKIIKKQ